LNIQEASKNDPQALLYFCLNQSSLMGGIRSAVHALHSNTVSEMVKTFMATFHRFVNSNNEMKLDDTFEIYLHLSSGLVNKPTNRKTAIPVRSLVGSRNDEKIILKGGLLDLPEGSPSNPNCFTNSCLLVALAYLIMQQLKPNFYEQVKYFTLKKASVKQKNQAANLLMSEIENVCKVKNVPFKGPHDILSTIKAFSEMFDVQIICILSMVGTKPDFICWPTTFDGTKKRVYLYQKSNLPVSHILAVKSLSTFFNTLGRGICFFCNNFYFTNFGSLFNSRHKCRSTNCCQTCFSPWAAKDTFNDNSEPWVFCNTKLVSDENPTCCSNCGVFFNSKICFSNHERFCRKNNYYWLCPVCQKTVSMQGRDVATVASSHNCNATEKYCVTCCKTMPLGHVCPISKAERTLFWPNIGVISLCFQDAEGAQCQECFDNHQSYMISNNITYRELLKSTHYYELLCSSHREEKLSRPNIIKIYFETERFEFKSATFSDDNFLISSVSQHEQLNQSYCHHPQSKSLASSRKRRKNADIAPSIKLQNFNKASSQLINFLIKEKLTNYTFLIQTNQEMLYMLELALEHSLHPTVVQSGRLLKKIYLSCLDITFLLFENYCKGSLNDLQSQFELRRDVAYFPMIYNSKSYHGKIIDRPNFKQFLSFTDTADDRQKKLAFYSTLPAQFDVNYYLMFTVTENLKTFLLSVIKFVQLCFELQDLIGHITGETTPYPCHPFASNILSMSGFAMAIFKFYYLNNYAVYSVLRPYTGFFSRVSSKEYEYLSFMSYTRPAEDIVHAFNSTRGQMRFDNVIVDGFGKNSQTVYQFHGCMVSKIKFLTKTDSVAFHPLELSGSDTPLKPDRVNWASYPLVTNLE